MNCPRCGVRLVVIWGYYGWDVECPEDSKHLADISHGIQAFGMNRIDTAMLKAGQKVLDEIGKEEQCNGS